MSRAICLCSPERPIGSWPTTMRPADFDLAQKAIALEPRYSWAQIALARALVADKRPLQAERGLRFARQYSRFSHTRLRVGERPGVSRFVR